MSSSMGVPGEWPADATSGSGERGVRCAGADWARIFRISCVPRRRDTIGVVQALMSIHLGNLMAIDLVKVQHSHHTSLTESLKGFF
jgi:hypothetical protein